MRVGPLVELVEVIEPPYHYVIADFACQRIGGELRAGDDAAAVQFVPVADLVALGATELVRAAVAKALALPPW